MRARCINCGRIFTLRSLTSVRRQHECDRCAKRFERSAEPTRSDDGSAIDLTSSIVDTVVDTVTDFRTDAAPAPDPAPFEFGGGGGFDGGGAGRDF